MSSDLYESASRLGIKEYFEDAGVKELIKMRVDMGANEDDVKSKLAEQMGYKYTPKASDAEPG